MREQIYLPELLNFFHQSDFRVWTEKLPEILAEPLARKHGDSPRWEHALSDLPTIENLTIDLTKGVHLLGRAPEERMRSALQGLMPWRKGPFHFAGVEVDTEWRSNLKWDRVAPHIDFKQKNILDVGCGNGYYGFRMLGAGAKSVIGVDPNWLFLYQFLAVRRYLPQETPIWQLPLPLEALPKEIERFDLTFSMGVFYHRRSPIDHLYQLKETLRSGGELLLETLVIDGGREAVLMPEDRYAQMRNVWFIPSVAALTVWLERVGFTEVELLDLTPTTVDEQRSTEWMTYLSLADFLDPNDSTRTIEGHPAPLRAVLHARKP